MNRVNLAPGTILRGIALLGLLGALAAAGCTPEPQVIMVTATPPPTSTPPPPQMVTVCASGCDYATIQAAIDDPDTVAGSTIDIVEAVHTETDITVNKDVTIQGQGPENTVIQAHAEPSSAPGRVLTIEPNATVVISGMTIRHGNLRVPGSDTEFTEDDVGGAGIINHGTLTLEECVVSDNIARHAGGILNKGFLTAFDCTFRDNVAYGSGLMERACGTGGGIKHVGPMMELVNCSIIDNTADVSAGGIHVACESRAVLTNCTISGNTAEEGFGGGIAIRGTLDLYHCTIADNTASGPDAGGGVRVRGTLNYTNSIIANNNAGGDCTNERASTGSQPGGTVGININNLVGDGGCDSRYSGDPQLDVLSDNGGWTLTYSLLPGSPAIDAIQVDECSVEADQRGQPRPQGAGCDIGAVEMEEGQ